MSGTAARASTPHDMLTEFVGEGVVYATYIPCPKNPGQDHGLPPWFSTLEHS